MSFLAELKRCELARRCGDRSILPGQFEGIDTVIDYPCTLELEPAAIDAAAEALRADPEVLRALRNAQGRLAEAEGEAAIYRDLRMKLFIDPEQLKLEYAKAEPWLQALKMFGSGGLKSAADSSHFNDQAERYATGNLRDVYFYPDQLDAHTQRSYQPGQ